MFDANNISWRSYVSHQVLTPAGWLQNYIRKQKCHTIIQEYSQEYFQLKITSKLWTFILGRKDNLLIKKKDCINRLKAAAH